MKREFKFKGDTERAKFKELEIIFNRLMNRQYFDPPETIVKEIHTPSFLSCYSESLSLHGIIFKGMLFKGKIAQVIIDFKSNITEKDVKEPKFTCSVIRNDVTTAIVLESKEGRIDKVIDYEIFDGDKIVVSCEDNINNIHDIYCSLKYTSA